MSHLVSIRLPKYWSFTISPSKDYSGWFLFRLTSLISSLSKGLSRLFSSTSVWRHQFFGILPSLQLSQPHVTTEKTIALIIQTFVGRVMSLLFNTLSRFVIAFLPRSNRLLISWQQSPSSVILEPKKRKSVTTFTCSPSIWHEVMGQDAMNLFFFLIFSFKKVLTLHPHQQAL